MIWGKFRESSKNFLVPKVTMYLFLGALISLDQLKKQLYCFKGFFFNGLIVFWANHVGRCNSCLPTLLKRSFWDVVLLHVLNENKAELS